MAKKDKKNFLVLGLGYFGAELAKQLYDLGADVVAVDQDPLICASLANDVTQAIEMNPADEEALRTLGISDYDACIIARGSNLEDSISIAATLREEKAKKVIARAVSKKHGKILSKMDVDQIIFPEIEIADTVAEQLVSDLIYDKIVLKDNNARDGEDGEDAYVIELFNTTGQVGKSLKDYINNMPKGTKLVAIHRKSSEGEIIITNFEGEAFQKDDLILVWGPNLRVKELE